MYNDCEKFSICWQKSDRLFFLVALENPSSSHVSIIVTIAVSDGSLQLERKMYNACKTFSRLPLDRSCLRLSFSVLLIAKPVRNVSELGGAVVPSGELSDSQLRTLLLKRKSDVCIVCGDISTGVTNGSGVSTISRVLQLPYTLRRSRVSKSLLYCGIVAPCCARFHLS